MTRDELLDQLLGKCDPFDAGSGWGTCRTHRAGWAPSEFKDGRCWKALVVVDAVLDLLNGADQ